MARTLCIGHRSGNSAIHAKIPLSDEQARDLMEKKIIYECGNAHGHDLHLDPSTMFNLTMVEDLCIAIAQNYQAPRLCTITPL